MSRINWPDDSIFEPFNIFETTYKTVSSHEIKAAILIPKQLKPGLCPLAVNIHGGFYTTGHSLFAPFFAPWLLTLALENSAIIVSGDYRLLPTPNGVADQLEDIEDFWQWTRRDLSKVLESRAPGYSLDFNHLVLVGESAGGYYATQLALSHPDDVSVLAIAYPGLDLKDELFVSGPKPGAPTVLRFPLDELPSREEYLAWVQENRKIVKSKAGFEISTYPISLAQHGDFFSQMIEFDQVRLEEAHLPMERVKNGAKLPKNVWVIHGDDDSVVYLRQSQSFVDLVKSKLPTTNLRFDIAKGQDHAFDVEPALWQPYKDAAMKFVVDGWL